MASIIQTPFLLCYSVNTITTLSSIPYGLAGAGSIRISNELGGGRPEGARLSLIALMLLAGANALVLSLIIFGGRKVFGYIFSNEKEVVGYATDIAPLVCLSIIVECIQGVLSGVARGCGWQYIGAYINFAAFYLFGIPIAVALGFWVNLRGKGLWIGLLCGAMLQTLMLSVITALTNREKQASMARERLLHEDSVDGDMLT